MLSQLRADLRITDPMVSASGYRAFLIIRNDRLRGRIELFSCNSVTYNAIRHPS
jgi:hypothetical protein